MLQQTAARSSALAYGAGLTGLDRAAHAAPEVGHPAGAEAGAERGVAGANSRWCRCEPRLTPALRAGRSEQGPKRAWAFRAPCAWRYCASAWRRFWLARSASCIRPVEHRVAVGLPPGLLAASAGRGSAGFHGAGPPCRRRARRQRRAHVVGPDGAGRQQQGGRQGEQGGTEQGHGREAKSRLRMRAGQAALWRRCQPAPR